MYLKREGKKLRRSFKTQAEAKSWRADTLAAANHGRVRMPTSTTVREAAGAFIAGAREGSIPAAGGGRYKPATLRGYVVGLDKRVLPAIGDVRLADLRRADVQELADRLTAEGLSASTVQNTLDPLRVIFRRALRREEVSIDPTKDLELRRPDGKRDRIADPAEAGALIAALPEGDRALWATAFYAGLRRGELMALRWSDVDLPGRVIRVQRGWDMIEGEQEGKSVAANRRVPILNPLAHELAEHKLRTRDGFVFGATATKPFTPESVRRRSLAAWQAENERRIERADDPESVELLEPMKLHEARHTCASVMIAAGVNAKALSTIMGHATITMTFDTYGHLMPGDWTRPRRRPTPTSRASGENVRRWQPSSNAVPFQRGILARTMTEESTTPDLEKIARKQVEAFSRGDIDAAMNAFRPDAVWDSSAVGLGTHEGLAAIHEYVEEWMGSYEDFEIVMEEFCDLGNGVTQSVNLQKGRLVGSIGFVQLRFAGIAIWAEGLIERLTTYQDIEGARAAAERLARERG